MAISPAELGIHSSESRGLLSRIIVEAISPLGPSLLLKKHPVFTEGEDIPSGDGHPVATIPGSFRSDRNLPFDPFDKQFTDFREWIQRLGYTAISSGIINLNIGPQEVEGIQRKIDAEVERTQRRATIVTLDTGGEIAAEIALRDPKNIEGIIFLGSDVSGLPFNYLSPDIRLVSIFSKSDGFVDWRKSVHDRVTKIEVEEVTHITLMSAPNSYIAIGTALPVRASEKRRSDRTKLSVVPPRVKRAA